MAKIEVKHPQFKLSKLSNDDPGIIVSSWHDNTITTADMIDYSIRILSAKDVHFSNAAISIVQTYLSNLKVL